MVLEVTDRLVKLWEDVILDPLAELVELRQESVELRDAHHGHPTAEILDDDPDDSLSFLQFISRAIDEDAAETVG